MRSKNCNFDAPTPAYLERKKTAASGVSRLVQISAPCLPAAFARIPFERLAPARFSCRFAATKTPASLAGYEFHALLINVTFRFQNAPDRVRNANEAGLKYAPNALKTRPIFFAAFRSYFERTCCLFSPHRALQTLPAAAREFWNPQPQSLSLE
jgi:hypothetical protein